MLIEIPDPEVILSIVVAFLGGLFALYIVYKIKPLINRREKSDYSGLERLEFYERQLIDMKIRLDSLEIGNDAPKTPSFQEYRPETETPLPSETVPVQTRRPRSQPRKTSQIEYHNTTDYVLGLITEKPMTSRDIQNASRRSREHTARLMNKLFKEGLVERNTNTKPYSYSITDKGLSRLGAKKKLPKVMIEHSILS